MEGFEGIDLGLDTPAAPKAAKAKELKPKLHKGRIEYAPPFFTINIAHVEHMPEWEVIGVNGEVLQVQRGVDVPNIPQAFLNVLKQAVASRQVKQMRPDGTEYFEWKPYPAIPFQIVEGPYQTRKTPAEMA